MNYRHLCSNACPLKVFANVTLTAALLLLINQSGFAGELTDCNNNTIPDEVDIKSGNSTDCNGNGIPDECEKGVIDCNDNGVCDDIDIANETSCDIDEDGIPDECVSPVFADTCPTDIDKDGDIDIDDLQDIILAWGSVCPCKCPEDVAPPFGDGNVNNFDFLFVTIDIQRQCNDPETEDFSGKCALQVLTDTSASPGDWFGYAVDVDGDTAVIGALTDDGTTFNGGIAHIYQRQSNGTWTKVTELSARGNAVAIDGDTAIVGFHVFVRNQGGTDVWGEVHSGGNAVSIDLDGDTAIVGQDGSALIHARNQGGTDNWGLVSTLINPPNAGSAFGHSVGISGDLAIVGDTSAGAGASFDGEAYVFGRNEGGANNWGLVATLTPSSTDGNDAYGTSVSIDGDTAIVGDQGFLLSSGESGIAGEAPEDSGAAFIYQEDQGGIGNWGEVAKIKASDGVLSEVDFFGRSVSLRGDLAVVGSLIPGNAYLFGRNHGGVDNWGELTKLRTPSAADPLHRIFGYSVATDGVRAIVGDPRNSLSGLEAGSASIFAVLTGDVDGDGIVNINDLRAVILGWGDCTASPACCPADLDYNGTININDLRLVILNWSS